MKTNDIITENGYTVEQSISGYWRLMKDGEVIYDDSAYEDLNEDEETARAFFIEYITERLEALDKKKSDFRTIGDFANYLNEYEELNPEDDCIDIIQDACKEYGWTYTDDVEGYYTDDYATDGQHVLYLREDGKFDTRLDD